MQEYLNIKMHEISSKQILTVFEKSCQGNIVNSVQNLNLRIMNTMYKLKMNGYDKYLRDCSHTL